MTKLKTMVLALAGLVFTPALTLAQNYNGNTIGLALMNLNAATLKGAPYTMGDIWGRLRQDFRMSEVNPELVRRHEQYYASRSPYFNRTITRSQPYLYHIVSEVEKRQMPAEIALLPFIESAFVTKAKSHVGASGLWQFMPATGRHYGLEQTALYDGRHDVYAATDAALNYLQYLHGLFGDWSLALAAYNWGEGSVGRAIARAQAQGLDPVYENLRMPDETRNYVPKLLAVRNLINNPQAFGLDLAKIDNKPYFKVVDVDQPLDIQAAARLANISETEFLSLNPSFKVPVFVPKASRKMLLPVAAVSVFEKNYRQANKDELLSWDVYTAYSSTSLTDIAAKSGMSVSEIKRLNKLSGNNIAAGRSLLLAKNSLSSGVAAFSRVDDTDPLLAQALAQPDMKPVLAPAAAPALAIASAPQAPAPVIASTTPPAAPSSAHATTITAPTPSLLAEATPAAAPQTLANSAVSSSVGSTENLPDTANVLANADTRTDAPVTAATEHNDPLLALAQAATVNTAATPVTDMDVRASVQAALAKAEAEEAKAARLAAAENSRRQAASATAAPSTHKVKSGDTLFSIAQRYNLNVADLVSANKLKGSSIHSGQVLNVAVSSKGASQGKVQAASGKGRTKAAAQPTSYTVKKGDTLHAIANRFNVPVATLQKLNKTNAALQPGQKIKLTGI